MLPRLSQMLPADAPDVGKMPLPDPLTFTVPPG